MRRIICSICSLVLLISGCAGRMANPISTYLPGDKDRTCNGLKTEIVRLQSDMASMLPKTDKSGTNFLWAAGGVVFLFPFFFMDLKDAEKIEYEAFRRRHNWLLICAEEKNCDLGDIRAEMIPNTEQQMREARKLRAEKRNKNRTQRIF